MPLDGDSVSVFIGGLEVIAGIKEEHGNVWSCRADKMKNDDVLCLKTTGHASVVLMGAQLFAHQRGCCRDFRVESIESCGAHGCSAGGLDSRWSAAMTA